MTLICPKCQNAMRTVDRQGIHIDQCDSCRGIFLDRGELEQILTAEKAFNAAPPPPYQPAPGAAPAAYPAQPAAPYPPAPQPGYGQPVYRDSPPGYRDSPPGYGSHGGHYGHGGHYKKRRKSFLEELFD